LVPNQSLADLQFTSGNELALCRNVERVLGGRLNRLAMNH
jgi:hypothetical protein